MALCECTNDNQESKWSVIFACAVCRPSTPVYGVWQVTWYHSQCWLTQIRIGFRHKNKTDISRGSIFYCTEKSIPSLCIDHAFVLLFFCNIIYLKICSFLFFFKRRDSSVGKSPASHAGDPGSKWGFDSDQPMDVWEGKRLPAVQVILHQLDWLTGA